MPTPPEMTCECTLELKEIPKERPEATEKEPKKRSLSALWQEATYIDEAGGAHEFDSPTEAAKSLNLETKGWQYRSMIDVFEKQGYSVSGNGPVTKGGEKFIIRKK